MHACPEVPTEARQQRGSTVETRDVVEQILARWEAPDDAHERFRTWARELSQAHALRSVEEAVGSLRAELRRVHEELAYTLLQFGHIDEALVSRRWFVAHLLDVTTRDAGAR